MSFCTATVTSGSLISMMPSFYRCNVLIMVVIVIPVFILLMCCPSTKHLNVIPLQLSYTIHRLNTSFPIFSYSYFLSFPTVPVLRNIAQTAPVWWLWKMISGVLKKFVWRLMKWSSPGIRGNCLIHRTAEVRKGCWRSLWWLECPSHSDKWKEKAQWGQDTQDHIQSSFEYICRYLFLQGLWIQDISQTEYNNLINFAIGKYQVGTFLTYTSTNTSNRWQVSYGV